MYFPSVKDKDIAFVNYLMVRNGTIVQTQTNKVETHLDETQEEILGFSVAQLRTTFNSDATEIIVPFSIEYPQTDIAVTVPKGGDKKKLLELSEKNVNYFIEEIKNKERLKLTKNVDQIKILEQLQAGSAVAGTASFILNVLTIPISREVTRYRQWYVSKTGNPAKRITGILM